MYFDLLSKSFFYLIHSFLIANFLNRKEGSIIKSMGGANPDSTNGIKNLI
jgi:hypothetical protein